MKLFLTLGCVVGLFMLLSGCGHQVGSSSAAGVARAAEPVRSKFTLSASATRAKDLIDVREFDAAKVLLDRGLVEHPADAGLLCQYLRLMILARDPAYADFIQTPLFPGNDWYWAQGAATRAMKQAVGLDPRCKSYLVELTLESFLIRIDQAMDEDRGFIGAGQVLYDFEKGTFRHFSGVSLSMVDVCFHVIQHDPEAARRWVKEYEVRLERLIKIGKVASAMMLGNLIGEMRQNANSTADFLLANKAFRESLKRHKPDGLYNWVKEAADAYPLCFRDEMLATQAGKVVDPALDDLIAELKSRGIAIPRTSRERPENLNAPTGSAPK